MYTVYDILSSLVIGGILLVMIIGFNGTISQESALQTIKVMTQSNLTTAQDLVNFEFRKMGFRVSRANDSCIVYADQNKITFKGDVDYDGTTDVLTYALATTPSTNANKNTRYLFRTFNGQTKLLNLGLTNFQLSYYDSLGTLILPYPIKSPSKIKSIKVAINVESTVPYIMRTERYLKFNPGVYWEQIVKPMNIQ